MAQGSYRKSRSKKKGAPASATTYKIALFSALIVLGCIIRFADTPGLMRAKEVVGSILRTDADYKGAVEVLGRAISGEDVGEDGAIMVFGKKILGLEDTIEPPPPTLPAEELTTAAPPLENGGETENQAGLTTGLIFDDGLYPAEDAVPVFAGIKEENPMAFVFWDEMEYDDDTPNEAFEIPPPDLIDTTLYELPFEYAPPAKGRVSSEFGYRVHPISGNTTFHHGADLAIDTGTAVKAFAKGEITQTGYHNIYGYYIKLDHGDGFLTMYAHLDKVYGKKGDKVKLGQKIALSGNSGYSTGAHLHFEIRKDGKILNPFDYVSFEP